MPLTKELIQQLREHIKMFTDARSISVTFKIEDAKALIEEVERLQKVEQDLLDWCDLKKKGWSAAQESAMESGGKLYNHTCFPAGVESGYAWMKDHIPHIFSGEKCNCPK